MRRFLLTGAVLFAFAGASQGISAAAEPLSPSDVPSVLALVTQTAPEGGPVSPSAISAAKARLAALDPVAPTAGADLAMWGNADGDLTAASGSQAVVRRFASGIIQRSASLAVALTRNAMRFIGTPYVFGGTTAGGFDCSGFVQHVFLRLGLHLPRTADAQYAAGHPVSGGMRTGDLVFFQTYESGPSHVGIYLDHDRFIHSSSSMGVVVSSLHDSYWSARYLGAKRVTN